MDDPSIWEASRFTRDVIAGGLGDVLGKAVLGCLGLLGASWAILRDRTRAPAAVSDHLTQVTCVQVSPPPPTPTLGEVEALSIEQKNLLVWWLENDGLCITNLAHSRGPFVEIGPLKILDYGNDAVAAVYFKAFRALPKSWYISPVQNGAYGSHRLRGDGIRAAQMLLRAGWGRDRVGLIG
jgi:hypothetical protein